VADLLVLGLVVAPEGFVLLRQLLDLQVLHASADPGAVAAGATFLLSDYTVPATAGTYSIDVWYDHDADGVLNEVGTLKTSVTP